MKVIIFVIILALSSSVLASEESTISIIQKSLYCDDIEKENEYCLKDIYHSDEKTIDLFINFNIKIDDFDVNKKWDYAEILSTQGKSLKNTIDTLIEKREQKAQSRLFLKHKVNSIYIYYFKNHDGKGKIWIDKDLELSKIKDKLKKDSYINLR